MPLVSNLGHGIWEIRIRLNNNRIARILFFMEDHTMILVHGFIKKTQKTPPEELKLARKRKKTYNPKE